jgi:type VI protein secretion system component VasF
VFDFITQEVLAYALSVSVFVMLFVVLYFAYETSLYKAQDDAMSQLDREEEATWN